MRQRKLSVIKILKKANIGLGPISGKERGIPLKEAMGRYFLYLKGKGTLIMSRGLSDYMIPCKENSKNNRTKSEEILAMVEKRIRCSEILAKYLQLIKKIYKLARFRPPRTFRTEVLHLYDPYGVGKTTSIYSVLQYLSKNNYCSYSVKFGGMSRFFNEHDNDDIVWIDDPSLNKEKDSEDSKNQEYILSKLVIPW